VLTAAGCGTLADGHEGRATKGELVDSPPDFKPPYMSFQTFWNFLTDLSAKPLPRKLDRSIMQSKSGTDQNNLMAALEGFGFIDGDGVVQPSFQWFQEATPEQRKETLSDLLSTFYGAPLGVSANNGTPNDLAESFRDRLGMTTADTRRKAITFFLHAAREAGIDLSPHFPKTRAGSGAPGTPKPQRSGSRRKAALNGNASTKSPEKPGVGEQRVVLFGEAGTVTIDVDVRWLDLPDDTFKQLRELIKNIVALGSADETVVTPQTGGQPSGPN